MSVKTDYSAENWKRLIAAPYYTAMFIVIADFNVTFFKEITAMALAVLATIQGTENELLKQIANDFSQKRTKSTSNPN